MKNDTWIFWVFYVLCAIAFVEVPATRDWQILQKMAGLVVLLVALLVCWQLVAIYFLMGAGLFGGGYLGTLVFIELFGKGPLAIVGLVGGAYFGIKLAIYLCDRMAGAT
jgi:hypothetical protein